MNAAISTLKTLFSNGLKAGLIVSVFGLAGAFSTWGVIKLVVTGEVVVVPDLHGVPLDEARARLVQSGLTPLLEEDHQKVHNEAVAEDHVLLQTPRAGVKLKKGRVVELTLSAGPRNKALPSLTGKTLNFAEILLRRQDTRIDKVAYLPTRDGRQGEIIAQNPAPREDLGIYDGVSVLLSTGNPEPWYVAPDLMGKHYLRVKHALETRGFRVVTKFKALREGAGPIVVNQVPRAGYPLRGNQTVVLEVNKD